jgi:tetratricopeptide (TPR) repeat protein
VDGIDVSAPKVTKVSNSAESHQPQTAKEWHRWFQNLPPLDAERELHKLKRTIGALHAKGDYQGALDAAQKLEATVLDEMGNDNAVYASCLNNVALMHKMLGEDDLAVDAYTRALHIYEDVTGKRHASYASTLSNIGILYRGMAEKSSGMDRLQLIERAEEALSDALETRKEISGTKSRESISTAMNLAMLWRVMDPKQAEMKAKESEESLQLCVEISTSEFGAADALTATILSNYGLFLKDQSRFADAQKVYEKALDTRSATLGDTHPDTIVSMHNLAECHLSMGQEEESVALQEKILRVMGHSIEEGRGGTDLRKGGKEGDSDQGGDTGADVAVAAAEEDKKEEPEEPPQPMVTYATRPKKRKGGKK